MKTNFERLIVVFKVVFKILLARYQSYLHVFTLQWKLANAL